MVNLSATRTNKCHLHDVSVNIVALTCWWYPMHVSECVGEHVGCWSCWGSQQSNFLLNNEHWSEVIGH